MKIYKIETGSSYAKQWAFAAGWGPLDGPMPFLDPEAMQRKIAFWKVNPRPPGIIILDTPARLWPDFLDNGGSPPNHFVSRRVLESLERVGIPYARATSIPIAEIRAKKLRAVPPPDYFVLEADQGIKLNFHAMGVPIDAKGNPMIPATQWQKDRILDASKWNGLDLFGFPGLFFHGPNSSVHCTERVVELAKKDGWTHVVFEPRACL
jgi:hypothetical protein